MVLVWGSLSLFVVVLPCLATFSTISLNFPNYFSLLFFSLLPQGPSLLLCRPMTLRPQEIVDRLSSQDAETRLRAVRLLKNEIIGSKNKKLLFIRLGAVPHVVGVLNGQAEAALLVQAAAALGSFAYGIEEGVQAVVDRWLRCRGKPPARTMRKRTRDWRCD